MFMFVIAYFKLDFATLCHYLIPFDIFYRFNGLSMLEENKVRNVLLLFIQLDKN